MKLRKIAVAVLVVLSAVLVMAETDAHKTFDQLKGMEGNWVGKNGKGEPFVGLQKWSA